MLFEGKDFFSVLINAEPEKRLLMEQGFSRLLSGIHPGIEYFNFDNLAKFDEPAQYPIFNTGFIPSPIINKSNILSNTANNQPFNNYARNPMTKIRVDPPVLQNMSQNIQSSSATLNSIGNNLTGNANGAPSYEGQFGPKVREIAAGGSSLAGQLAGKFSGLASWLSNKAQQFLNADNTSSAAVSSQYNNLSWMQWLLLGGIFPPFYFVSFLSRYFPNGINWNWLTGNITSPTIPSDPQGVSRSVTISGVNLRSNFGLSGSVLSTLPSGTYLEVLNGRMQKDGYTWVQVRTADGKVGWMAENYLKADNSTSSAIRTQNQGANNSLDTFASNVPAGIGQNGTRYWRNAYVDANGNYVVSNCTWYAAAAVKQYSGGKIDFLNDPFTGAGDGSTWDDAARIVVDPRIRAVDFTPEIGDIYQKGPHVAFVQDFKETPESWIVTISEENAGSPLYKDGKIVLIGTNPVGINQGQPIGGGRQILVNNDPGQDVKRFVRVETIKKTDKSTNFIHINYD